MALRFLTQVELPQGIRVAGLDPRGRVEIRPGRALKIGTSGQCDVVVAGVDIGRVSCALVADEADGCRIAPAGNVLPVLVNGVELRPRDDARDLADGDVIQPLGKKGNGPCFQYRVEQAVRFAAAGPAPDRADPTWRPPSGLDVAVQERAEGPVIEIRRDGAAWAELGVGRGSEEIVFRMRANAGTLEYKLDDFERMLEQARARLLASRRHR